MFSPRRGSKQKLAAGRGRHAGAIRALMTLYPQHTRICNTLDSVYSSLEPIESMVLPEKYKKRPYYLVLYNNIMQGVLAI